MTFPAVEYADRLLDSLGCAAVADGCHDPLRDWAASGAMALGESRTAWASATTPLPLAVS